MTSLVASGGPEADGAVDGRAVRSARTRLAIVDALRELNNEGDLRPTASQVAERAGVSRRTVWQHFVDLESLFAEAGRRDYEVAMTFLVPVDLAAPLEQRIAELIEQRARLYEAVTPVWRAGRLHQPFSPQMRRNSDHLQQTGWEQLQRVFAPELTAVPAGRQRAVSSALQVATGWSTWDSLRTELGLAAPEAEAAVVSLVQSLLQAT